MIPDPIIVALPVSPEDAPYWVFDGVDPGEYLTVLDSVSNWITPDVPPDHIAADLLGAWGLYQLESHHTPPWQVIHGLIPLAEDLGYDLLVQNLRAAWPKMQSALDDATRFHLFEEAVLQTPWFSVLKEFETDFAKWVEANFPRFAVPSKEAWMQWNADKDKELRQRFPDSWRAQQVSRIGEAAQQMAETLDLPTVKRIFNKPSQNSQFGKPIQYQLFRRAGTDAAQDADGYFAIVDFADAHVFAHMPQQVEIARIPRIHPWPDTAPAMLRAADAPKFRLIPETMELELIGMTGFWKTPFTYADQQRNLT